MFSYVYMYGILLYQGKMLPIISPIYGVLKNLVDPNNQQYNQDTSGVHLLALHLWIHITEQSDRPSEGEDAADLLNKYASENITSHLGHMPAHIYFRTGSTAFIF